MTNSALTYPERYALKMATLKAMPEWVKIQNAASHRIGVIDNCRRCVDCEIASWNAWQQPCCN